MKATAEMHASGTRMRLLRAGLLAVAVATFSAGEGGARPLTAQGTGHGDGTEPPAIRLSLTGHAGASLQENLGRFRVGRDAVTYGLRVTAVRRAGLQPWVDVGAFRRPGLECLSTLPCARSGSLARAGVTIPLSPRHQEPGLHGAAHGGLGAAFAGQTSFSYTIGFAVDWRRIPRLSPTVGVRWEHIAGINFTMLAGGLRLDL